MTVLNVAILGQGRSGRDIHGSALLSLPGQYRVVAVVEPLADRRARAAAEYGCEVYPSQRELHGVAGIDLVVNATPSNQHTATTLDLLEQGFNVLCDKPFATTVAEVDRMERAATAAGRTLAVFQQSRYAPYFREIRSVVESGRLGRIVQVSVVFSGFSRRWDWQTLQEFNGGNLANTGPHPLDQALQLMGSPTVPQVWARMDRVNTFGDAEDYVRLLLSAPGCPVIDLEISSCAAYPRPTYEIQGSLGGLRASQTEAEWRFLIPDELPHQELVRGPLRNADGTPAYCSEDLTWHTGSWRLSEAEAETFGSFEYMSRCYYDMLHRHLTTGAPLEVTIDQVRQQIAVIEEAHRQNPLDHRASQFSA